MEHSRLGIVVVADDLTGAADTGVHFCGPCGEVLLACPGSIEPERCPAARGIACYSQSRGLPPSSARERVAALCAGLAAWAPERVYKKIDSCLRGHPGPEAEAVMEAFGHAVSFVAPAYPEMGRTTVHDVHYVDGIPLERTEAARDPVRPVRTSRLSKAMAAGSRFAVGHVDIGLVDGAGVSALAAETRRLMQQGVRHLVFDAAEPRHLDRIAALALETSEPVLLVGSGGLGKSLARRLTCDRIARAQAGLRLAKGGHLLVVGTASERSREQLRLLAARTSCRILKLDPDRLAGGRSEPAAEAEKALAAAAGMDVALLIQERSAKDEGGPGRVSPERVAQGLGALVADLLQRVRPASLFLTGGDTAHAVLQACGALGIMLQGEIVPGVVRGVVEGGPAHGISVVTKAGAFGDPRTLLQWRAFWKGEAPKHA